ncbi:hypothetical protein TUM20983_38660 [Mycobacterium antarcticum]|uniref:hypothetical protein n=1 Tax=Mycolicibacterium sp. TUM20983 TaxID=3023369 RepID=UPI0023939B2D|nr:hypothetical protein [Mycolicibacterium sp. TUM20983]GLP76756.1 hypothetical protein TUM20983_38660 [Mycolicibacterium sp. TUM20983]
MCYAEKCPTCGKTGWAGCGEHVDDVMRSVPVAQRCTCARNSAPQPRAATASSWGRGIRGHQTLLSEED